MTLGAALLDDLLVVVDLYLAKRPDSHTLMGVLYLLLYRPLRFPCVLHVKEG